MDGAEWNEDGKSGGGAGGLQLCEAAKVFENLLAFLFFGEFQIFQWCSIENKNLFSSAPCPSPTFSPIPFIHPPTHQKY